MPVSLGDYMRNNLVREGAPDAMYFHDVAKPSNLNQIVNWYHRLYAAWLVFSGKAVAVKWYSYADALERNRRTLLPTAAGMQCGGE